MSRTAEDAVRLVGQAFAELGYPNPVLDSRGKRRYGRAGQGSECLLDARGLATSRSVGVHNRSYQNKGGDEISKSSKSSKF